MIKFICLITCHVGTVWSMGFAGGDTTFGNPYRVVNVDMLHQSNLGVLKTLVDILRSIATSTSAAILPELDQRLLCIKNSSRFSDSEFLAQTKEDTSLPTQIMQPLSIGQ